MNNYEIVEKIKTMCNTQNLKTGALLKKAGLSSNVIDDWLSNKTDPSFPALFQICKVLNIEIADLFETKDLRLTNSQLRILHEWNMLNNQEKNAVIDYIVALKSNK